MEEDIKELLLRVKESIDKVKESLKHSADRHCIKVEIIKYIKKYGKSEVQEILDEIKR